MRKKIFITGINGFAGSHLAELLVKLGDEVHGVVRSKKKVENITNVKDSLTLHEADLLEAETVHSILEKVRPEVVYHLAAYTPTGQSFKIPSETISNNVSCQVNLFEGVRKNNLFDTKIMIASSAEIYGLVSAQDLPVDEETQLRPISPYAVSKIAQDYLGLQYFLSHNLRIIRVRPFNHIGPRQSTRFVVPDFAKQIAMIEKNKKKPAMKVGNLESKRDFADVRDIILAYTMLVENGKAGEVYNIGSGASYKIADILDILLSLSKVKITVEQDSSLFRPTDTPDIRCDNTKLLSICDWKPQVSIEDSLRDTLEYWRKIV